MPIAKLIPDATPVKAPPEPMVEKSTYLGVVADHQDTPVEALVAYLDGLPWTVNYYSQILGLHSDIHEVDTGQTPATQQYQKVNRLELKVDSSLQSSYDAENGLTTVTGSATIIQVVPNINDYFIADAGTRDQGLYRVKNVERRIFNRNSVYLIDYELVCYVRDDEARVSDIESKVIRQYYFDKERIVEGLSPILREEEWNANRTIEHYYHAIIRAYFNKFFNRSLMLLLVPNQGTKTTYDVFLANFLAQIVDTREAPEIQEMKYVSIDHDRYMKQGTLWTALINREISEIEFIHKKMVLAPRSYFNKSSWIKSAIYWNVHQYVYPRLVSDELAVPGLNSTPYETDESNGFEQPEIPFDETAASNLFVRADVTLPLIYPVRNDDYYILSSLFYEEVRSKLVVAPSMSVLEILIRDYLKLQTIDLEMLGALLKAYSRWPVMEQFYYGPLLILLMKQSIQGFYQ